MKQKFPDGNDRTPNDPCLILSSTSVARLYEDAKGNPSEGAPTYTTSDVMKFFKEKAKEHNWDSVTFINRQVLLRKNIGPKSDKITREELLRPLTDFEKMHTEELFRQSGRTTRMVQEALRVADTGKNVVIVMKDESMVAHVRNKFVIRANASVISYNHSKGTIDWSKLQATGEHAKSVTFIDHDVIYFNHRELFRAQSRFDEFSIKGDCITIGESDKLS